MCISHSLSSLQKMSGWHGVGWGEMMLLWQHSTLRTGTSPLRPRDTVLAGLGTAEDAKRNLEALGLVNLPSTFFSLCTLFIPLEPGSAVDFFPPFLSAALA